MNLYRVKYGRTRGAGSWGDWKYYEDEDILKADLLEANLDVASDKRRGSELRIIRAWSELLHWIKNPGMSYYDRVKTTNIFAVEKAVGNEWVPVEVTFIEPEVVIN